LKTRSPRVFSELGRVMAVNPELEKHKFPKEVTEVGMVIPVKRVLL
jgi:hypothetical protein